MKIKKVRALVLYVIMLIISIIFFFGSLYIMPHKAEAFMFIIIALGMIVIYAQCIREELKK